MYTFLESHGADGRDFSRRRFLNKTVGEVKWQWLQRRPSATARVRPRNCAHKHDDNGIFQGSDCLLKIQKCKSSITVHAISFCFTIPKHNPRVSRISVVAMTGAVIEIDGASDADTIRSVKYRVFASNRELRVRQQRLMYRPGPRGMEPLADNETLGSAGVAQDGTAELDVLLAEEEPMDKYKVENLRWQVWLLLAEVALIRLMGSRSFSFPHHCFTSLSKPTLNL